MSKRSRDVVACGLVIVMVLFWFAMSVLSVSASIEHFAKQEKDKRERPLVKRPALDDPDDEKLFVWGQPDKGDQSTFFLRVVDEKTVEVALLVPVTLRLTAPPPTVDTKAWKKAMEDELGGKLVLARFEGRNRDGVVTGDLWLGKKEGWLGEALKKRLAEKVK